MYDNQLFKLIRSTIKANLAVLGIDTIVTDILQSYQPTQQGTVSQPVVYLYKVSDAPIGSPKRESKWDVLPPQLATNPVINGENGNVITDENGNPITADTTNGILANVPAGQAEPFITDENGNIIAPEAAADQFGMVYTQTQAMETTFQVMALVPQDAADTTGYTASDIVNMVRGLLQTDAAMQAFQAQEVGMYRPTVVRNPYWEDDRDQNEASPNFDFVVTHKQTIVLTAPVLEGIEVRVFRI